MSERQGTERQRILVNIPILNEIEIIEKLVTRVTATLKGYDYLLLIVDDGSTDGTLEYLTRAAESNNRIAILERHKTRSGCQRGAALLAGLKWGLNNGDFDIFVEMDGDLSHVPEELPAGIQEIASGRSDVTIVSKYVPGSQTTGRSFGRTLISIICNAAVRSAINWRIHDFSNGYRFYNRAAADLIPPYEIRYGSPIYLTEVMAIWLTNGMRISEIPGHYVGRNEGLSKVRLVDYVKAGIGVGEIGLRYHVTGFEKTTQELLRGTSRPAGDTREPHDR
jgi:dolichol-phosphate mannosyltransferase